MQFSEMDLQDKILKAVSNTGYVTPTPIQAKSIPAILSGRDILAAAQTGTGKTAGFTLPLLEQLAGQSRPRSRHIRSLILAPTRELAAQIKASIDQYSKYLRVSSAVVIGGVGINNQLSALKKGLDILVATPGRLLDIHNQGGIRFDDVTHLILDEADRMLDMGFLPDIRRIVQHIPKERQTMLFSATFSKDIRKLADSFLTDPVKIDITPRNSAAETVKQVFIAVDKGRKNELLKKLFKAENWFQALVFTRTKHGADKVCRRLKKDGLKSAAIHGNKSQNQRIRALESLKNHKVEMLIATDIAARGLDIKELPTVVNFDLPSQSEDYVHRIGRTGRAGEEGYAVSFVSAEDEKPLREIEKLLKKKIDLTVIEGFEPSFTFMRKQLKQSDSNPRKPKEKSHGSRPPRKRKPRRRRSS